MKRAGSQRYDKWLHSHSVWGRWSHGGPWFQRKQPALQDPEYRHRFLSAKKKKGLRYPWRLEFTLEVPCTVSPHYIWQLTWTVIPKWKLNFEIHVHCTCALNLWTPALFYVIQVLSHFLSPFIHYSSLTYKSDAFGYWKEMHFWNQIFLHIKIAFESDISFL